MTGSKCKCEAADAVEALDPGVPYESRWAPYVRIHGPGQGQFPKGSIRPRGYMAPDARRSLAGGNVATLAPRRQRPGGCNPRPCTVRWQAPRCGFQTAHSVSSPGLTGRPSIPETALLNRDASGILDRPLQCAIAHKAGDDIEEDKPPHSRGTICPSSANSHPQEIEGAGNAGCWPHPQPCVQR